MRYYRYDLDQIAAVLDLTAHALSILFILALLPLPRFLILSFVRSVFSLAAKLKIGTGLKVPARPHTRARTNR